MEQEEINKIVGVLYKIIHKNDVPDIPNFSKDVCIKAIKKLFDSSGIDDFTNYMIKECINKEKNTDLEECLSLNTHTKPRSIYNEVKGNKERRRGLKRLNKTIYKNDTINMYAPFKDYDLPGRYYNLLKTLKGHVESISCVHLMNSKYLITAGDDKLLKFWSLESGMLVKSLTKHYAPINDLSLSCDNKYLASCDLNGVVIVWNIQTWETVFVLELNSVVELVEFIPMESNFTGDKTVYKFIMVVAKGVVKQIVFDSNCIVSDEQNSIMSELGDEDSLRAICISEGGRFILCGGAWPFLFVFDTQKIIDNVLTLETDGYSVVGVCASANKPRFCASSSFNFIYEWEYILHGVPVNNIFRKNRNKEGRFKGYWNRRMLYLCTDEYVHANRVAYMSNDLIVSICSDNKIRILDNDIIEIGFLDVSVFLTHPTIPIFVVCGAFEESDFVEDDRFVWQNSVIDDKKEKGRNTKLTDYLKKKKISVDGWVDDTTKTTNGQESDVNSLYRVRIYNISGKLIYEKKSDTKFTDGYFSKDGSIFCLGDDTGKTMLFSTKPYEKKYEGSPDEQFFRHDFSVIYGNDAIDINDDICYNVSGVENKTWRKEKLTIETRLDRNTLMQMGIESNAIKHMGQNFLNYKSFKQKYIVDENATKYDQVVDPTQQGIEEITDSSETTHYDSDSSSLHDISTMVYLNNNTRKSAREAVDLIKNVVLSDTLDNQSESTKEEVRVRRVRRAVTERNSDDEKNTKQNKRYKAEQSNSSCSSDSESSTTTESHEYQSIRNKRKLTLRSTVSTSKSSSFPPRRRNASFNGHSSEKNSSINADSEPKIEYKKVHKKKAKFTRKNKRPSILSLNYSINREDDLSDKIEKPMMSRRKAAIKAIPQPKFDDSDHATYSHYPPRRSNALNSNRLRQSELDFSGVKSFDDSDEISEEIFSKRLKK